MRVSVDELEIQLFPAGDGNTRLALGSRRESKLLGGTEDTDEEGEAAEGDVTGSGQDAGAGDAGEGGNENVGGCPGKGGPEEEEGCTSG